MKLIVGLGNPGKEYNLTRHNVGFMALAHLAEALDFDEKFVLSKKMRSHVLKDRVGRTEIALIMPDTFMNDSGTAVEAALNFYKITPKDLLVIHDDKDIQFGETRLQTNRGPAGHNGVSSIIEKIGTQDFTRVRIGVGPIPTNVDQPTPTPPKRGIDTASFVLGKFTKEELAKLKTIFDHVTSDLRTWIAS